MISTYFDRTLKYYGIQAKALSQMTGVSENHISEFRRGKLKTGMTTTKLWDLIVAMDELAPGSRKYFCMLMSGVNEFCPKQLSVGEQLEYLLDVADDEDLNRLFIKMGRIWTHRRNNVKCNSYTAGSNDVDSEVLLKMFDNSLSAEKRCK
ncbi:hypothetical protein [Floridanema evergladense]|uniref:XRE family transcriptional regulator n=1 Tax=Floridaenema evergladense BLCC-F167 TaxID=3153639 RepID=A0ABV4WXH3_9CYAN